MPQSLSNGTLHFSHVNDKCTEKQFTIASHRIASPCSFCFNAYVSVWVNEWAQCINSHSSHCTQKAFSLSQRQKRLTATRLRSLPPGGAGANIITGGNEEVKKKKTTWFTRVQSRSFAPPTSCGPYPFFLRFPFLWPERSLLFFKEVKQQQLCLYCCLLACL